MSEYYSSFYVSDDRGHTLSMGLFQSFAKNAFGFGFDGVTGDHALGDASKPDTAQDATTGALSSALASSPTTASVSPLNSVEPSPEDILLGRGKNVQYHPGNVKFREWLEEYREEYERTPRTKKRRIATEMVQILTSNGIRFLKQQHKNWVVVDSKEAEEKISQLFRSRRKKQRE